MSRVPFILLLSLAGASCQRMEAGDAETQRVAATQAAVRDTMRIQFERSGGFAGMTVNLDIDADSLPESERILLSSLVNRAEFFSLPARTTSSTPSRGADQFTYRITIESDGRRHTVETTDGTAPDTLIPLLDWLNGAARRMRSQRGS